MKRGLKDPRRTRLPPVVHLRYNRFPDEKGTESTTAMLFGVKADALQPFPR